MLAFSALPPIVGFPTLALLMILLFGNTSLGLPALGSTASLVSAAAVTIVALLVFAHSARRLLLQPTQERGYWRTPQVLTMRGQLGLQGGLLQAWQNTPRNDSADYVSTILQTDAAQHTCAHSRQADTTRTIRIVLGPPYAPQRLRRAARPWLLVLLVFVLAELLTAHLLPAMLLLRLNVIALIWLVVMALWFAPGLASARLRQVFVRTASAEVALLALLPGLGDAAARRHGLLRATLLPVLQVWGLITAILVVAWLVLVGKPIVVPGILLLAALGALLTSGAMLAAMNGRDLESASLTRKTLGAILVGVYLLLVVAFLMTVLPFALSVATQQPLPDGWQAQQYWIALTIAVVWLGTLTAFAALLRRQWRAFIRRPHPFMQR
jgi:hypothetical protein